MQNIDEAIRERAYHLWIADGRPEGNADAYWLSAQREILASSIVSGVSFDAMARVEQQVSEMKYPAKKAKTVTARKGKRRAA